MPELALETAGAMKVMASGEDDYRSLKLTIFSFTE
jgi:hypothetical protein